MNSEESLEWLILLEANSIPGTTKIECVKKILEKETNLIRKRIILNSFLKKIIHPSGEIGTDSHYYRLEHYYHRLKENPSKIKEKSGWEDEIEVPLRRLFKRLQVPFYFKSSLEFKKAVIRQYEEWNLYHKYDYFEVVVEFLRKELEKVDKLKDTIENSSPVSKLKPKALTFGFAGDKKILRAQINELCFKVDLLNSDLCNSIDLENLMISDNIDSTYKKIYIDCETTAFSYILKKLKPNFKKLTPKNIEKTMLFHSKGGKPITAQNLYSSNIKNEKLQAKIDKIFNEK